MQNKRLVQKSMIFRFVEDMTFKEIAYEMKEPFGKIIVTYYRALKKYEKI